MFLLHFLVITTLRTPDARFPSGNKTDLGSLPSRTLGQMSPRGNNEEMPQSH